MDRVKTLGECIEKILLGCTREELNKLKGNSHDESLGTYIGRADKISPLGSHLLWALSKTNILSMLNKLWRTLREKVNAPSVNSWRVHRMIYSRP